MTMTMQLIKVTALIKSVTVCSFRRERNSSSEIGVALMSENGCVNILDMHGKPLNDEDVWSYSCLWPVGCFTIPEELRQG